MDSLELLKKVYFQRATHYRIQAAAVFCGQVYFPNGGTVSEQQYHHHYNNNNNNSNNNNNNNNNNNRTRNFYIPYFRVNRRHGKRVLAIPLQTGAADLHQERRTLC